MIMDKRRRKLWFDNQLANKQYQLKVLDLQLLYDVKLKFSTSGPYRITKLTQQGTVCLDTLEGVEFTTFINGIKVWKYYGPLTHEALEVELTKAAG